MKNLPPSWSRMSHRNKAAYLCNTHQARDFADACAQLARLPRRKTHVPLQTNPVPSSPAPVQWWQSGSMA